MKTLNSIGKQAIIDFLKRRHKCGPNFEYPVIAWATEAETTGKVVIKGYMSNDGQGHSLQMRPTYFDENEG